MKLQGVNGYLIENKDYIKYLNGHVIINTNKLFRKHDTDSYYYHLIYDNKSYRCIEFPSTLQLRGDIYFDEIKLCFIPLNLKEEIEKIKKINDFNNSFVKSIG